MTFHSGVASDVSLAPFTTYKVGGSARWFCEPNGLEELRSVLEVMPNDVPIVVLGRGSNVVISDAGLDALVIRLGSGFAAIEVSADGLITAGAALALPILARTAAAAGRGGLEFYVGIPGSVGGAVTMNAGGHGSDTASVLVNAVVLDTISRDVTMRDVGELGLAYRHSELTDQEIVLQARFATESIDPKAGEDLMRVITRWRKENQPGGTLNAGSVFRNPPGESAGQIIDRLGLKGEAIGPIEVSEVHANFMIATRDATATDIYTFVCHIQSEVRDRAGIDLEPEIRFLGSFQGDRELE